MNSFYAAIDRNSQEILGSTAIGSFGTAITISTINQYLTLLALVVSIVTGGIVIYKHFWGKKHGDTKDQ